MHIPDEHRAHVMLWKHDLKTTHDMVFIRAAFNYFRKNPALVEIVDLGKCPFAHAKGDLLTWAAAKVGNSIGALPYFAKRKEELNRRGVCVLEGFLHDSGVPDALQLEKFDSSGSWVRKLFSDMAESYKRARRLSREGKEDKEWHVVLNEEDGKDQRSLKKGEGRFITTNYGVMEAIEQDRSAWTVASTELT